MKGHSILPFFWPHLSSLANTFISKEFLRLFHFHHHVVKLEAVCHCTSQEPIIFLVQISETSIPNTSVQVIRLHNCGMFHNS